MGKYTQKTKSPPNGNKYFIAFFALLSIVALTAVLFFNKPHQLFIALGSALLIIPLKVSK